MGIISRFLDWWIGTPEPDPPVDPARFEVDHTDIQILKMYDLPTENVWVVKPVHLVEEFKDFQLYDQQGTPWLVVHSGPEGKMLINGQYMATYEFYLTKIHQNIQREFNNRLHVVTCHADRLYDMPGIIENPFATYGILRVLDRPIHSRLFVWK
jgi:hypothetical protein